MQAIPIVIDILALASITLTFFIVTVSPGPATVSNAVVAMHHGRRTGLAYGSGLSCGLAFWGLIAASGMGVVLQTSIYLLAILKILGGFYLLWLAYLSARSAWHPGMVNTTVSRQRSWFLQGLLLNLSNPKAVLAWMAALSVGLTSNAGIYAVTIATGVCSAVGFLVYALYSVLFSVKRVMYAYTRCRRWIEGAAAGLFALAGIVLIRSAFDRQFSATPE